MPPPAEGFAARLVLGPALRTQPDRRLVMLVREGYEAAFEEIVRRYGKPLGRYAAAIVGGRGEDVIQDSFSKALLALRRDDAEIELRPWLYRIVRNTALNDLRDRPPSAEALAEAIAGGRSAAEEAERREELTDLMRRLRSLPEPQRAAIVMRELEGLSHEEIAAALGLSGGAARQAIYRARQALRDGLGMLLPLPLLKLLVDHGGEAAVAGAGAGGAAAAGGALGGGAGVALKAGVVTAVLAGSVGTGIALRENRGPGDGPVAATAAGKAVEPPASAALAPQPVETSSGTDGNGTESSSDREPGDDGEGPRSSEDADRGKDRDEHEVEPSGSGPNHGSRHPDDRHGEPGDRDGPPGSRHSGPGGDGSSGGHSGRGPGGDGHGGEGGGGSSGPGGGHDARRLEESGGSGQSPPPPPPPEGETGGGEGEDSSGSGPGGSDGSSGEGREGEGSP